MVQILTHLSPGTHMSDYSDDNGNSNIIVSVLPTDKC